MTAGDWVELEPTSEASPPFAIGRLWGRRYAFTNNSIRKAPRVRPGVHSYTSEYDDTPRAGLVHQAGTVKTFAGFGADSGDLWKYQAKYPSPSPSRTGVDDMPAAIVLECWANTYFIDGLYYNETLASYDFGNGYATPGAFLEWFWDMATADPWALVFGKRGGVVDPGGFFEGAGTSDAPALLILSEPGETDGKNARLRPMNRPTVQWIDFISWQAFDVFANWLAWESYDDGTNVWTYADPVGSGAFMPPLLARPMRLCAEYPWDDDNAVPNVKRAPFPFCTEPVAYVGEATDRQVAQLGQSTYYPSISVDASTIFPDARLLCWPETRGIWIDASGLLAGFYRIIWLDAPPLRFIAPPYDDITPENGPDTVVGNSQSGYGGIYFAATPDEWVDPAGWAELGTFTVPDEGSGYGSYSGLLTISATAPAVGDLVMIALDWADFIGAATWYPGAPFVSPVSVSIYPMPTRLPFAFRIADRIVPGWDDLAPP